MIEQRKTCHGCAHLGLTDIAMGGSIAFCKKTEAVVPQHFQSDPPQITYWRVPLNCPLPESEVLKSEDKAPEKDWHTVMLSPKKRARSAQ